MDPKNLSQLDPKLREAYERVMGSSPQQTGQAQSPTQPTPLDPIPSAPPPQEPQAALTMAPAEPNPVEPLPTLGAVPDNSAPQAAQASPSVFGADVSQSTQEQPADPSLAPMEAQMEQPVNVPPPPPPPPSVAQNDPTFQASVPATDEQAANVHPAGSPNKIIPILIVVALVVFLLVWAFFWVQLLL